MGVSKGQINFTNGRVQKVKASSLKLGQTNMTSIRRSHYTRKQVIISSERNENAFEGWKKIEHNP